MPLMSGADFQPQGYYKNGHYNTCVPYILGQKPEILYTRERIKTPDNDFLDLDFLYGNNNKMAVLCHGLEGSSQSRYMLTFADYLLNNGWDVMAINYRGCSGVMNDTLGMYNSGTTGDLHTAIGYKLELYDEFTLIGFSLGGNLVLKYLGESKYSISSKITRSMAISAPIHLADSSRQLLKWRNYLYQLRFLSSLSSKIIKKKKRFPDDISLKPLLKTRNLYLFDNYYTAPLYGYKDAEEYYAKNQAIQWLENIEVSSLIINAKDDPFLGPLCYPKELVADLSNVTLCIPDYGGHVGFAYSRNDRTWILEKTVNFINSDN